MGYILAMPLKNVIVLEKGKKWKCAQVNWQIDYVGQGRKDRLR